MHAPSKDYKVCQFIHACMFMVRVILDYLLLSLLITYCIALMTLPRSVTLMMKSSQVLMLSILVIILSIRSILSKKRLFDILYVEYKVISNPIIELQFLFSLLSELSYPLSFHPILQCDNLRANYLMANMDFHSCIKYVEIDFDFVHEMVSKDKLQVQLIVINGQIVDVLTKPLSSIYFFIFYSKLIVCSCSQLTCKGI